MQPGTIWYIFVPSFILPQGGGRQWIMEDILGKSERNNPRVTISPNLWLKVWGRGGEELRKINASEKKDFPWPGLVDLPCISWNFRSPPPLWWNAISVSFLMLPAVLDVVFVGAPVPRSLHSYQTIVWAPICPAFNRRLLFSHRRKLGKPTSNSPPQEHEGRQRPSPLAWHRAKLTH